MDQYVEKQETLVNIVYIVFATANRISYVRMMIYFKLHPNASPLGRLPWRKEWMETVWTLPRLEHGFAVGTDG